MTYSITQPRRLDYAWFGLSQYTTQPSLHWKYEGDMGESTMHFGTWYEAKEAYNTIAKNAATYGMMPRDLQERVELTAACFKTPMCPMTRRMQALEAQIQKLADVLLEDFGGPTLDESACEMAVRLLKELKSVPRKAVVVDKTVHHVKKVKVKRD